MELLNLALIVLSALGCIAWAVRKRGELATLSVEVEEDGALFDSEKRKAMDDEQEDLEYVSQILHRSMLCVLQRLTRFSLLIFLGVAALIWFFFDESLWHVSQPFFFLAGAMGQLALGNLLFRSHNMFDPRMVMLSRVSKWFALDHLTKLNAYLTLANQAGNLVLFAGSYGLALVVEVRLAAEEMTEREFERFHRRFLCYGLGSVVAFFVTKSLASAVCHGSALAAEALARQTADGIEEDHPKNPAQIMLHIGRGFLGTYQSALEFNALTNMGLCIFQDFFVTRSVYLLDRGFLDGLAIYALGMVGALAGTLVFRRLTRFQVSDACEFTSKLAHMRRSGLLCVLTAVLLSSLGAFVVMWRTFPDAIAVYDPFERKISLRNLTNIDSFLMFATSTLIVAVLIANSLFFTSQRAAPLRALADSSRVSFSLALLASDYWSYYATAAPMAVFFLVLYLNYRKGNIYGVTVEYLGLLTYFQVIVYFQNFKSLQFYFKGLIAARRVEDPAANRNFRDVAHICRMFGKFSNGVALFTLVILCFVILLDGFNLQIVKSIVVIEPFYILGLCAGCVLFALLSAADVRAQRGFSVSLLRRIKLQVQHQLNEPDYEPPMEEIAARCVGGALLDQLLFYHLPVAAAIALIFALFGKKMTIIVVFGCFLFVLFTCYQLILKSEMLVDLKSALDENAGRRAGGAACIGTLSNIVGQAYCHHVHDCHSKLLLLLAASMLCAQFFIEKSNFLSKFAGKYLDG